MGPIADVTMWAQCWCRKVGLNDDMAKVGSTTDVENVGPTDDASLKWDPQMTCHMPCWTLWWCGFKFYGIPSGVAILYVYCCKRYIIQCFPVLQKVVPYVSQATPVLRMLAWCWLLFYATPFRPYGTSQQGCIWALMA